MAELGSAVLSAVGHLSNLGAFAEVSQSHVHQKEQIRWARRAYRLDKHAMRIELLNAAKEDIRDHYETYITRIDTMLLVQTLLFTFALGTLQFSDLFVLRTDEECPDCLETNYPVIRYIWVCLISGVIIIPFWSMVSSIWCKLQLDRWLEMSVGQLNKQFRTQLWSHPFTIEAHSEEEAERAVQEYIQTLGEFVVQYQRNFHELWTEEVSFLVRCATRSLWVSALAAVCLTSLMFCLWLASHHGGSLASCFTSMVLLGLSGPTLFAVRIVSRRRRKEEVHLATFAEAHSPTPTNFSDVLQRGPSNLSVGQTPSTLRRMSSTADVSWEVAPNAAQTRRCPAEVDFTSTITVQPPSVSPASEPTPRDSSTPRSLARQLLPETRCPSRSSPLAPFSNLVSRAVSPTPGMV